MRARKIDMKRLARQSDRLAEQTAAAILKSLSRMMRDLPEDAAPQMMIELVVGEMARQAEGPEAWLLRLIMEDYYIRETYYNAVAKRPLKPTLSPRGAS